MGILDGLRRALGGIPLLSCRIELTEMTDGTAKYNEERPPLDQSEYARFLLHFYAKMLFNYCTDRNMSGGVDCLRRSIRQLTPQGPGKHGLAPAVGIVLMENHAAALASLGDTHTDRRKFTGRLVESNADGHRAIHTGVPLSIYPTDPCIATLVAIREAVPLAGPTGCDLLVRGLGVMESALDSGADMSSSQTLYYLPNTAFLEALRG
jgi:hypothetical protein